VKWSATTTAWHPMSSRRLMSSAQARADVTFVGALIVKRNGCDRIIVHQYN
jgi:hypothetical protein